MVSIGIMNKQINVRLPMKLREQAAVYAKKNGYGSIQELIAESVRDKLEEDKLTVRESLLIERIYETCKSEKLFINEKEFKKRFNL
jgi:Arc/MetJ-type ribon-helix-helix transcriptional regulator